MTTTTTIGAATKEEGGWLCRGKETTKERGDEAGPPRTKFDGEEEGYL